MNILLSIRREQWFIDESFVSDNNAIITALLQGTNANFSISKIPEPQLLEIAAKSGAATASGKRGKGQKVGVLSLMGPILKYDGECGQMGMNSFASMLRYYDAHEEVGTIILHVDSPGGTGSGARILAEAIASCKTKTIAYVEHGMAASAAYWGISQCDEIYINSKHSSLGSVGAFMQIQDDTQAKIKEGVFVKTIYAPQSTEKGQPFRNLLSADDKKSEAAEAEITEELRVAVEEFFAAVQTGRGERLKTKDYQTGKLFNGDVAVEMGLADGICSFEDLIQGIQTSIQQKSNTIHMATNKFAALMTLLAFTAMESTEEGIHLSLDDAGKVENALAGITAQAEKVQQLTAQLAEQKTANEAQAASLESLTAERDAWQVKADTYAKNSPPPPPLPVGRDATHSAPVAMDAVTAEAQAQWERFNA